MIFPLSFPVVSLLKFLDRWSSLALFAIINIHEKYINHSIPRFVEAAEPVTVQGVALQEGLPETAPQTVPGSVQDVLTIHGSTQGESSDAASIHTASTSVSGNGNYPYKNKFRLKKIQFTIQFPISQNQLQADWAR